MNQKELSTRGGNHLYVVNIRPNIQTYNLPPGRGALRDGPHDVRPGAEAGQGWTYSLIVYYSINYHSALSYNIL